METKWFWIAGGIATLLVLTSRKAKAQTPPELSDGSGIPASDIRAMHRTVQEGDTYSSIAKEIYGEAAIWPAIFDANRDTLGSNPDLLTVGDSVFIPMREALDPLKFDCYRRRAREHLRIWTAWKRARRGGVPSVPSTVTAGC